MTTFAKGSSWNNENAIDLADHVHDISSASAEINTAAALAVSEGKALVSLDPTLIYVLTGGVPLVLESLPYIDFRSKTDTSALDATEDFSIITGNLANSVGGFWNFGDFISSNSSGNGHTVKPQLRINGTKSITMNFINMPYIQYFQTDEVTNPAGGRRANAYNLINFAGRVGFFEVSGTQKVVNAVFFNENKIYGGRIYRTVFRDKGYAHNHNNFYNTLMEDDEFELTLEVGHNIHWHDCRMENISNSAGITFASGTSNNTVTRTWNSSHTTRETILPAISASLLVDNGLGNSVRRSEMIAYNKHTIFSVSNNDMVVTDGATTSDSSSSTVRGYLDNEQIQLAINNRRPVIPCQGALLAPFSFTRLVQSDLIPVVRGQAFDVVGEISTGNYRFQIQVYDVNGIPLDDSAALDSPSATYDSNGLWTSGDLSPTSTSQSTWHIDKDNVGFIRVLCSTGSSANTLIQHITCRFYELPEGAPRTVGAIARQSKRLWLDAVPIMGYASLGTEVGTPGGDFECSYQLSTSITTEVANGAVAITVTDFEDPAPAGSPANGDIVGISLDDGTTHWSAISDAAGGSDVTFTIDSLVSPAGTVGAKALAGAYVTFTRWAAQ